MLNLKNFFDDSSENFQPAVAGLAKQELAATAAGIIQPAAQPNTPCDHATTWLDAYGAWHCETCYPPIIESEVRQRRSAKACETENKSWPWEPDEIQLFRGFTYSLLPESETDQVFQKPVPEQISVPQIFSCKCGSKTFWVNLPGEKICMKCSPPKKSHEAARMAEQIRVNTKFLPPHQWAKSLPKIELAAASESGEEILGEEIHTEEIPGNEIPGEEFPSE